MTDSAPKQPLGIFQAQNEMMGLVLSNFSRPLLLWLAILMVANMGGLAVSSGWEVKIIAVIMNVGGFVMARVYQKKGFVRLLGLGHFPWFVMLPWIVFTVMPKYSDDEFMTRWFSGVVILDGVSLLLDARDVYRYLTGDNKPMFALKKEPTKKTE